MSQIAEYIKMALMNIRTNKGRSFLTMLGIIIGISSVILVISVGQGVAGEITEGLNSIAGGQLYFYSNANSNAALLGGGSSDEEIVEFTLEDLEQIRERIPHIKGATTLDSGYGTADGPKEQGLTAYLYAGTEALQYQYQEPIIKGRYFNKTDFESAARVCVIRESSAVAMFGTTDVIGQTFTTEMYGKTLEFKIIGIREDAASSKVMSVLMYFDQVEMEAPLTVLGNYFGFNVDKFSSFYVYTDGPEYATEAASSILQFLRTKYHVPEDSKAIDMQDFNDSMDQINKIMDYITAFVVLVAAISLLVGGIGVMNIMLVSVTERTREIGIRKALGARTRSIMLQFLFESAIITMLGGLIGIVLGVAGASVICGAIGIGAKISPLVVILTTLFSSAVGLFFGIYPARKAARLSPIEALRRE
ncbi:MAG: ABC transporter permease [Lachnospiraceae bacterium]|nr:ABC transporter permease [Lachnospiraceae bacterium]